MDGYLLEELGDELDGVADRKQIARGSKVLLHHGYAEVKDEDDVSNDAALKGCRIFRDPALETGRSAFPLLYQCDRLQQRLTPF